MSQIVECTIVAECQNNVQYIYVLYISATIYLLWNKCSWCIASHKLLCTFSCPVLAFYVHYVHSTWYLIVVYMYISQARLLFVLRLWLGTQRTPFMLPMPGILLHRLEPITRARDPLFGTQGPLCNFFCIYLPMTIMWLVIPSLNLVVSCLHVLYYLYLHIFMLFRSSCSWLFFCRQPTQGSYWSPKYTSCIFLYLIWNVQNIFLV